MSESQPVRQEQSFLKSRLTKIDEWNFDVNSTDQTRIFLGGLINEVRDAYDRIGLSLITIPETLLPDEIKQELTQPYGRLSVLLGKGSESTRVKEDRDKTVVIVQGEGHGAYDQWSLFFTFENEHIRLRQDGVAGENSIKIIGFERKYKNNEQELLKIVGKLTKASLTQSTLPTSSKE